MRQKTTAIVSTRRAMLLAGSSLAVAGCFGSFPLTNIIYGWNGSFGSKWIRWLIFLGLIIIPVYEIALIVDALILNTIEFWTGGGGGGGGGGSSSESSSPSTPPQGGGSPKRKRKSSDLGNGHRVAIEATESSDLFRIEHHVEGRLVRVLYLERIGDHELRLFDEQRHLVAISRSTDDRGIELLDARLARVGKLDTDQCSRVEQTVRSGASVAIALRDELLRSDASSLQRLELARRERENGGIY